METETYNFLVELLGSDAVLANEPMSSHTTFRIGGPADYFVNPICVEQIQQIAAYCVANEIDLHVLGCGSNVLVADAGLRGITMRLGPRFSDLRVFEDGCIVAQAGAKNSAIARAALDAGLGGFEFAAGIPGSIGGAAIMNAGAYDGELKDVATGLTCLTADGQIVHLNAEDAQWGYRSSAMAQNGAIVLEVELKLHFADPADIKARMDELAVRRSDKQPLDMPSAGSTFKRPLGHFAGKLIQDAGMQGYSVGGAQISTKHAGFVVNTGGATASDVRQLISDVAAEVYRQFQVQLEPEVRFWGF